MGELLTVAMHGDVGVVTIDSPPVNALGHAVRQAVWDGVAQLSADAQARAIVIACGGRTFFAGADISEFGKPFRDPDLRALLAHIEAAPKPTVAAIHGTALGGGYELALVCSARIALPSAKVGLPEVKLGLLPGAGGTQRLPRLIGPEAALEVMTSGAPVPAPRALELGMIDSLAAEGRLVEDAVALARSLADGARPVPIRDRSERLAGYGPDQFAAFRSKHARTLRGFDAPQAIVEAVEAAAALPFDEGMARERELFVELMNGPQSKAQRHLFFAERETAKVPDLAPDTPALPIKTVGVIGAGTMGGGIAMNFVNAGIPVTIVEQSQAALDRGLGVIRRNYESSARRGRMTADDVERRMALLTPALELDALAEVDLVIEAVFESMDVKRDVFGRLDSIAKPGAILASNTSYLDIDSIARATARPESVLGLHFFSPANVMRLLEVVRGERTAAPVLATALKLARTIAKVPVVAKVCHGFIANRIMTLRGVQAIELALEGTPVESIDSAMRDYGFAMGPFQMFDLVGLDVIGRGSSERTLHGDLVAQGRLGQKGGGGFYDYDAERTATPSPAAARAIADFAAHKGAHARPPADPDTIVARLLYPVVNEGAKLLDEGIALRASDIDVAAVLGYNWPVQTGGPMFWGQTVGLRPIVDRLRALEAERGPFFTPAPYLVRAAEAGQGFTPSS